MSPKNHNEWPEHALCARCGAPLGENYRESPLGLRFCSDCFDGTIQEKVRERAAEIYLRGRCSNCESSLINGYRLSRLGVIYCIPCYENLGKSKEEEQSEEQVIQSSNARHKSAWSTKNAALSGFFWASLTASHTFLFIDLFFSKSPGSFLSQPASFFKILISLDLLTLIVLLAPERLVSPRLTSLWTLLIAIGFIILIGREAIGLLW